MAAAYSGAASPAPASNAPTGSPAPTPPTRPTSVSRAAALMMALVLLSRIAGMVRDMVIAHQFGEGPVTDAYNAAFTIPDLLMYLVAGGALSSTFVPVFSEYLHRGDRKGAQETFSIVATATIIVAGVFILLGEIFAPQLVVLLNPGYAHDPHLDIWHPSRIAFFWSHPYASGDPRLPLATHLTRILLPAQLFFMLGSLMMGSLNARNIFIVPALGPIIYNLGIILGAIVLRGMGIAGLTWGALTGAFVGNFALQTAASYRAGLRFRPSLWLSHPGVVKVWALMLPILLGVSLPNVDQMINKYFASELPSGSQTAMQFAVRLMLIPIGVFAQAMGIAILPTLSAHAATGERRELRRTISQGLRTIFLLTIPASALMYVLSAPIVALLYQHGEFTASDTLLTAIPLRFYALGIFAWSAQAILTRAFYAIQDSRVPVISGSIMTVVFIGMNWLVVNETSWGVAGLATATTIAATLHMGVMLYLLDRRVGRIASFPLLAAGIKIVAATTPMCAVAWATRSLCDSYLGGAGARLLASVEVAIAGAAGIATFVAAAKLLHVHELRTALAMLRRRRRGTTSDAGAASTQ